MQSLSSVTISVSSTANNTLVRMLLLGNIKLSPETNLFVTSSRVIYSHIAATFRDLTKNCAAARYSVIRRNIAR